MTLDEIVSQLEAVAEHALEGTYEGELLAWEATIPVQQDFINMLKKKIVAKGMTAANCDDGCKKIEKCCDKIIAACPGTEPAPAPEPELDADGKPKPVAAGPVGKLFPGDGSFLRNFAEFIKTVLPLIIAFIPK